MPQPYQIPVREEDRIKADLAIQLVAASTGVSRDRMFNRPRAELAACRARWLALYLAYITFGWSLDRVAHAFGLTRATAITACRWAEDGRDGPALDDLLERLEGCVRQVLDAPPAELPA